MSLDFNGLSREDYVEAFGFNVSKWARIWAFAGKRSWWILRKKICLLCCTDHHFCCFGNYRYAFGIVHDFGTLWRQHGFLTSSATPVKIWPINCESTKCYFDTFAIAVIKCESHTGGFDDLVMFNGISIFLHTKHSLWSLMRPYCRLLLKKLSEMCG